MPSPARRISKEVKGIVPFDIRLGYQKLKERWGPQHWWPGDTELEIVVGALLTQATNWRNAALAVANLKSGGFLEDSKDSIEGLLKLPQTELEELIRSSGYFRQKALRLQRLLRFLSEEIGYPPWNISHHETSILREKLLKINGLGPETVDSILLYGFGLPVFVVDAYTRRTLLRHGMVSEKTSYDEICNMFEKVFPERSEIYNEYHALIVRLGKEHCRSTAFCDGCPLFT